MDAIHFGFTDLTDYSIRLYDWFHARVYQFEIQEYAGDYNWAYLLPMYNHDSIRVTATVTRTSDSKVYTGEAGILANYDQYYLHITGTLDELVQVNSSFLSHHLPSTYLLIDPIYE